MRILWVKQGWLSLEQIIICYGAISGDLTPRHMVRAHYQLAGDLYDWLVGICDIFGRVQAAHMSLRIGSTLTVENTTIRFDPIVKALQSGIINWNALITEGILRSFTLLLLLLVSLGELLMCGICLNILGHRKILPTALNHH